MHLEYPCHAHIVWVIWIKEISLTFTWPHLRCHVGLEEGEYWEKKLYLCYRTVYCYNGAQRYEQFLQVGRLYRASILLGLAPCLQVPLCVRSSWCYIYVLKYFWLHPSLYLLVSWAWWDWPLTWLTNHRPSVLWHCWFGHLTCEIMSKITYNVTSGTLNPTIPFPKKINLSSRNAWCFIT